MSQTRVPAIPAPTDANLREVARAIKGLLDVREGLLGDPLDANVTFRDLQAGGVIKATVVGASGVAGSGSVSVSPGAGGSTGYDPAADFNPPPAPSGLAASGAISSVVLTWDSLPAGYINHAYTEVWRASSNVIGSAIMVGTTTATVYADALDPGQTRFYWIRHRSQANVAGPYNATGGVSATTGQDPSAMVAAMTGPGKPFTVLTESTEIGGVTFPAGIYSTQAFIRDLQVTNAKIANLAVDDAKIADLNVDKLNGSALKVGAFIQSTNFTTGASGLGWRINADGTAELQAAFIRGRVTASQIDGANLEINAAGVELGANVGPGGGHSGLSLSANDFNNIFLRRESDGVVFFRINEGGAQSLTFDSASGVLAFQGTLNVKSAAAGARMEITNSAIKVFDANGVVRVKIGNLAA